MSVDRDWLQPIEHLGDAAAAREHFRLITERYLAEMPTETLNFFTVFLTAILDCTLKDRGTPSDDATRELERIEAEQTAMLMRMLGGDQ